MTKEKHRLYESTSRFKDILNKDDLQRLLAVQSLPLPTGIRLNSLKVDPDEAIQTLASRYGWVTQPVPFCDTGWTIIESDTSPGMTIEHRMGQYYIQDVASMVPVSLFDVQTNHPLVLDMAASPGGKTTHLIDRTQDRGFIIANDSSQSRIPALRSVLAAWGGINQIVTNYPGEAFGDWFPETFDLILLDAPCSMENLRPTPNHPLRETTGDERLRLQERQILLLTSGLKALKVGGQLVYATCSLAPEEDEAVVDTVLKANVNAVQIKDISDLFSFSAPGLTNFKQQQFDPQMIKALRLWPHLIGTSGFFCVLLIKTNTIPSTKKASPSRDFSRTDLSLVEEEIKKEIFDQIHDRYGLNLIEILDNFSLEFFRRYDQLFLIPQSYLQRFVSLPYEYIGMPLGRWFEGTFEPSHDFISRFGHRFTQGLIQLKEDQVVQWIQGRDIRYPDTELHPTGQYLLVKDKEGRNLGIGKLLPKRLRNMLPRQSI
jgi:16S rRNA (cytosine1407-C5)-methyltransferase